MKKNLLKESILALSTTSRMKTAASFLAGSTVLMAGLAHADLPSQADINAGDVNTVAGDAVYSVNAATDVASITASQHSVVEFYGTNPTGNSLTIGAGDVLNLVSNGGAINLLLDDLGANPTEVFGSVVGDGDVSLYIRNTDGVIFGDDASVTNVPGFVASTHSFDNLDFVGFSNGVNPLEMTATGGTIEVRGLNHVGDKLVLITDVVSVTGDVVSSGEMHIAIGETVELNLPGTGMLSVDITSALATSSGAIRTSGASTIEADSIDWNVALADPASIAVNSRGVIKASGVSVASNGDVNIVAKGGIAFIDGELNANDGAGDVNVTGDVLLLRSDIVASNLNVELGAAALSEAASDGLLDVNRMQFDSPNVTVNGAAGFNHTVAGFANYEVVGENQSIAGLAQNAADTQWLASSDIQLNNIQNLQATDAIDNNIFIGTGTSIGSITGGSNNDTFTVEGEADTLAGSGGNDRFILSGGVVGGIDGGSQVDTIENVFLVDGAGEPTDVFTGQTSSEFVGSWASVEIVVPASIPPTPVDPAPPTSNTGSSPDNLLAGNTTFNNLSGLGSGSLQLAGDSALNAPCGVMGKTDAASHREVLAKEPCYDSPEYLALLNTTIYFDNDSSKILTPAAAKLDRVTDFVLESDMFREISVSGHTDSNASDRYNLSLSKRRADAAVSYMANKGIESRLFKTYSYGEALPAVPNDNAENLAKNRRAVIELKR